MTQPITPAEQAEAQQILDTDNGGAGLDVHMRAYFSFVAKADPAFPPVRSETGGIVGYSSTAVVEEIERLMDDERGHLDLAAQHTEPEMQGAHSAVAQNYRLAYMTRQTDEAYTAQTFRLDAVGWENLMPQPLALVYMGKSQGMWPRQRAEKDAAEVELAEARLLAVARENLAKRKAAEELTERAVTMTDAELDDAIKATKERTDDTPAFLILIRERDGRAERLRKARAKSMKQPASGAPWTEDEERMLKATERQTKAMDDERLRAIHARPYSTRGQELQREAALREMERRGI